MEKKQVNAEEVNSHQPDWEMCAVCGSRIESGRTAVRINHRGNTINLCGSGCLQTFAEEPDLHLARLAETMGERMTAGTTRGSRGCDVVKNVIEIIET